MSTLGCGLVPDRSLAPVDVPVAFAEPETVVVRPGDTLGKLAARHGVQVAELRAWNGIEGDTIEVDQVLLLWKMPPPPAPAPRPERIAEAPRPALLADTVLGEVEPAGVAPEVASGTADAVAAEPAAPQQRVAIERPMLAGLFGLQVGSDVDLEEAAAGMERQQGTAGAGSSLAGRNLSQGTDAESLTVPQRELTKVGPQIPDMPVTPPRLAKPAPKRCLSGASTTISESGASTSGGLSVPQINAGLGRISRYTPRCFPAGTKGSYTVIVEVTVACNGTVSNVYLIDGGVVPPRVTNCIQQTLGYASFAAHAMPTGVSFQYPMKFTF
ncbi:MAG: LysM peptidoglycan-binding domain-containing protein [Myxococcota bacterium]